MTSQARNCKTKLVYLTPEEAAKLLTPEAANLYESLRQAPPIVTVLFTAEQLNRAAARNGLRLLS